MSSDFWLTNRSDPRVQAALSVKCPICATAPGDDCGWPRGGGGVIALSGAVVHAYRVPEKVMFGEVAG